MKRLKNLLLIPIVLTFGCSAKANNYQSEIKTSSEIHEEKCENTTETVHQEIEVSAPKISLSECFPKDISVNNCVVVKDRKCFLTYSRNNSAMIGIYDISKGFIKEETFPAGMNIIENGITGSCVIFSDLSHQKFLVYDFDLNIISDAEFDSYIRCFTVSPNNQKIYYAHSVSEGDDFYTILYENTTDMTKERELYRKNDMPTAPFELMGFTDLYPLSNNILMYSGYSYPSVQIGTQSVPCSGQFNTEKREYTCNFHDIEKQYTVFNGGVMCFDKPLSYGMRHSGEVKLYTENGEKSISMINADESQSVYISHNGEYICSVLSIYGDDYDLEYTDVTVYSVQSGEKLKSERFEKLYADIKAVDEASSSVLIETYGMTNETPLILTDFSFW